MADIERLRGLNKINECLLCGTVLSSRFPGPDHYLPRVILRRPLLDEHPFKNVVQQKANKFRFCWNHHQEIDSGKLLAFCGQDGSGTDPVSLMDFLMRYYPMTPNTYYFNVQKAFIVYTVKEYIKVANSLNGELPKPLTRAYKDSVEIGQDILGNLQNLRCRAP